MSDIEPEQQTAWSAKPLDFEPTHVDVDVSGEILDRLLSRTEDIFEKLAQTEPHWTVLTDPRFKSSSFAEHADVFQESGRRDAERWNQFCARASLDPNAYSNCFELGCGVGRLTYWLAKSFKSVIAADVSQTMLDYAASHLLVHGLSNVTFLPLTKIRVLSELPPIDALLSFIVLQHNTPPVQWHILDTLLSKIEIGGLALFQALTFWRGYSFSSDLYLKTDSDSGIEMHVLPQQNIFALLRRHGFEVLEIREDGSCGSNPDIVSNIFFARKERP